jgi:hypothetical protein
VFFPDCDAGSLARWLRPAAQRIGGSVGEGEVDVEPLRRLQAAGVEGEIFWVEGEGFQLQINRIYNRFGAWQSAAGWLQSWVQHRGAA